MRGVILLLLLTAACQSKDEPSPAPETVGRKPVEEGMRYREERDELLALRLEVFETDEGMGYREPGGRVHIEPKFQMATDFTPEGIAWVADSEGLFWIDKTGSKLVRAFNYDNGADPFVENRARFVEKGRMGFIDPSGRVVVPARFEFLRPMEDGVAAFCEGCVQVQDGEHTRLEGGRWGSIDANGAVVKAAE